MFQFDVPSYLSRIARWLRRAPRTKAGLAPTPIQPLESRCLLSAVAYNFVSLDSFTGVNAGENGATPYSLIVDSHGNLIGGTSANLKNIGGTLFEVAGASGPISTVTIFDSKTGFYPHGSFAMDSAGNIYGVLVNGGATGQGGIFKYVPGAKTAPIIASFNQAIGYYPTGGVTIDAHGNLFGTTNIGGTYNLGGIFELPAGSSTILMLAAFNSTNGANPAGAVTLDAAGNIYGTAEFGGLFNYGTVFKLAPGSSTITVLASLDNTNGAYPLGNVVFDSHGNLLGTASRGGLDYGTVFEVAAGTNVLSTAGLFNGNNGYNPVGNLLIDADGNIVGSTFFGGVTNAGVIFRIPAGTSVIVPLISFDVTNGYEPAGDLITDGHGNIFGTTIFGGPANVGTVFEMQAINSDYVPNLYHDLLGRAPDPAGLALWNAALANGATPNAVANQFINCTEYRQDEIQAAYQTILGRPADPAGLQTWVNALAGGMSIETVQSQFYGSAEYAADHGGTATSIVSALYVSILGRTVDSAGLAHWTQQIAAGASITQVAFLLIKSPESSQRIVEASYVTFLHRAADPGGLAFWSAQLTAGASQTDLTVALVTSPEYFEA